MQEGRYENILSRMTDIHYPFITHEQQVDGEQIMIDAHYHEFIEILFCLKGRFFAILDSGSYTFGTGDMVVINSMEMHYIKSCGEGRHKYIVIQFNPELLYTTSQTIFEAKYVLPFTTKTSTHQKVFEENELSSSQIPELLKNILEENKNKKYGFELAIRTSLGEIFLWILRNWHDKGLDLSLCNGLNQEVIERLEKVFEYVDNHYAEPIGIEDLSSICNMSYSYFSRFFKKAMNRNFSDYVNLVRISKAENMLATTNASITDVAISVGFSSASYFTEKFKQFKDITPNKFRSCFINDSNA